MNTSIDELTDNPYFQHLHQYSIDIIIGRRNLNLTQPQLARLLGVYTGTVSKWEQGINIPKKSNYLALKKLLSTIRGIKYK